MKSRRPPSLLTRWLMVAGLMLGLLVQPVVGQIGELHALTHDGGIPHGLTNIDAPDGNDGENGDAGILHQSHHFAHCCAHVVMAPQSTLALAEVHLSEPRSLAKPSPIPGGRWLAPFRPPITV